MGFNLQMLEKQAACQGMRPLRAFKSDCARMACQIRDRFYVRT
jgi:hypothetical protein